MKVNLWIEWSRTLYIEHMSIVIYMSMLLWCHNEFGGTKSTRKTWMRIFVYVGDLDMLDLQNMSIMKPSATKLSGGGGYTGFTLFVRPSVCPAVRRRCPDDNLNSFDRILIFLWHMYHLGEGLVWDWIWAPYLIKYAHTGWSCDLGIFGIPRAFKLQIYRDLMGTHDKSPRFC